MQCLKNTGTIDEFNVTTDVRQGCILHTFWVFTVMDFTMKRSMQNKIAGIAQNLQ